MPDTGSTFGPSDPKIEAMIATKRAMEAARLQRIKDPKSRVMGIDTQALAHQVGRSTRQRGSRRSSPLSTIRSACSRTR